MSFLKMCVPADGVKGIKKFVLESIVGAGGKPCPPGIVGVGIGGSADYAMYLAKEAIACPIKTRNADPHVAKLEDELYDLLEPNRDRADGARRRRHRPQLPHRARGHAHDPQPVSPSTTSAGPLAARALTSPPTARSTTTGRPERDGDARGDVPHYGSGGDPQVARWRRGRRPGPHHRDPRPHADPDLRRGRGAADGPARRLPAPHGSGCAQGRRQVRARLHRHHDERAHGALHRTARGAVRRAADLRQRRLPGRGDRADAATRDDLFRDRWRRGRARRPRSRRSRRWPGRS